MRINVSQSPSSDSIRPQVAGMVLQLDLLVTRIGIFRRLAGGHHVGHHVLMVVVGGTHRAGRQRAETCPNCNYRNNAQHSTIRKANPQNTSRTPTRELYYTPRVPVAEDPGLVPLGKRDLLEILAGG